MDSKDLTGHLACAVENITVVSFMHTLEIVSRLFLPHEVLALTNPDLFISSCL